MKAASLLAAPNKTLEVFSQGVRSWRIRDFGGLRQNANGE